MENLQQVHAATHGGSGSAVEVAGGLAQGLRAHNALQQSALKSVGGALGHAGGVDNELSCQVVEAQMSLFFGFRKGRTNR